MELCGERLVVSSQLSDFVNQLTAALERRPNDDVATLIAVADN
jgi:hypothetical protein